LTYVGKAKQTEANPALNTVPVLVIRVD